jgi:LuxR family maltose regulon positive regulatory protein
MAYDVDYALGHISGDRWLTMCQLLAGAAAFMAGEDDRAAALLAEGRLNGAESPNVQALCLAHEAVIHVERDEWEQATALARRGRDLIFENGLDDVPNLFLVTALSALVEARAGRIAEARADHLRTRRNLTSYLHQAGWANFQARIALARASTILGDRVVARTLLDEVEQGLLRVPDAVRVVEQLESTRRSVTEPREGSTTGPSALTTAELRVLHHLPSHLTLAEIADRLFVSRNTVKTQAIAIYRKLDVSSRGEAVEVARQVGLLDDAPPPG